MNDMDALERLRQLPNWYYEFDVQGYRTPLKYPEDHVRHAQRRAYCFDPVVRACGGTLAGKRVLDLGCNEGYFLLAAAETGCEAVLGIDADASSIERAKLVFAATGVAESRYEFHREDFFEALGRHPGPFDVVFALGVLHWFPFTDHIRFLEAIARVNSDLLVIDTVVSSAGGSVLELREESLGPRDPGPGGRLRVLPSRGGLVAMMKALGYQGVVLQPCFSDWSGSQDYQDGVRRAFVFAKQTPLDRLAAPVERLDGDGGVAGLSDVPGGTLLRALWAKTARKLGLRGPG